MDDRRYTRRNWIKTATAGVAGATIAGTAVTLQSCAPKSEDNNDVSGGSEEKKPYFIRNKGIPCIYCSYCMPCKFGLDIPGIFRFVNEHMIVDEKEAKSWHPIRRTNARMAMRWTISLGGGRFGRYIALPSRNCGKPTSARSAKRACPNAPR